MNDDNKQPDEELNDFLFQCYQLKQRALRELNEKNSFPSWLQCLLQYPQKEDKAEGENNKGQQPQE